MITKKMLALGCLFFMLVIISGRALTLVRAASLPYQTPEHVSRPPDGLVQPAQLLVEPLSPLALPPMKAVLLVGPIDGDEGAWTQAEIANMELAAQVLESNGVQVHRFYPGVGTFAEIEAASQGAHFLLYRGHGVYDGNLPYPNVGGFSLSAGFYSPSRIRTHLQLAPNAIVMIYGCFAAGSSSASGDSYDIGIGEASRRVAQYSEPFLAVGASGYYSNWFGSAFEQFLSNLFAGQTLGDAYQNFFDFNAGTVHRTFHPDHPDLAMWVDKDHWDYWKYNNAFVGKAGQTLEDLFKPATLGGIPGRLDFVVDGAAGGSIEPQFFSVTPLNISADLPIQWTLATQGDWYSVSISQGETPHSSFQVVPTAIDITQPGQYTGVITVSAVSPEDTHNAIQTIEVNLQVQIPQLSSLPEEIHFYYSNPDQTFLTERYFLQPENSGSPHAFNLVLGSDSSWVNISPPIGATPQEFAVTVSGIDNLLVADYSGTVTIEASTPGFQAEQDISVHLHVLDRPFSRNFLPVVSTR